MTRTADVVIVGAGVMGASVAWHLTTLGCRSVVLLDHAPAPGTGSTGRATGGFRAQFASPINVRLSLLSREKLRQLLRTRPVGTAATSRWVTSFSPPTKASSRRSARRSRCSVPPGSPSRRWYRPAISRGSTPSIALDGVVGGSFGSTDGYIRPLGILQGYLDAAARGGAEVRYDAAPVGFERDGDRIVSVTTSSGRISAATCGQRHRRLGGRSRSARRCEPPSVTRAAAGGDRPHPHRRCPPPLR